MVAYGSRAYRGRKCSICGRVARGGQVILEDHGVWHRNCLERLLIDWDDYHPGVFDSAFNIASQGISPQKLREERLEKEFIEYRENLIKKLGANPVDQLF